MESTRPYVVRLLLVSLLLFAVSLVFHYFAPSYMVSRNLLLIVPFFFVLSLLSLIIHHAAGNRQNARARMIYLAVSISKLLLFIILLVAYAFYFREDILPFFISFMFFYLIYTWLDVKASIKLLTK
jgi:hypothetical protein